MLETKGYSFFDSQCTFEKHLRNAEKLTQLTKTCRLSVVQRLSPSWFVAQMTGDLLVTSNNDQYVTPLIHQVDLGNKIA